MRQFKINKQITPRETVSLDKYLHDISKEEMISPQEEIVLAQRIKMGDQQALEKLTRANLRFVVSVAKQYQNQGLALPDLINDGNLGLIKAAKKFDETRGFKFISYAVWWIRQSILQAIAEQARMVRIPLNKIGNVNKLLKSIGKLEQMYRREPTDEEIAEYLEMSVSTVKDIHSYSIVKAFSLNKPLNETDSDEGTHLDLMKTEESESTDHKFYIESLQKEIARTLAILTPRERETLILFFGIGGITPLSLEEIGEKFELTRERVRQIKEKAIRRLKQTNRSKLLRQYIG